MRQGDLLLIGFGHNDEMDDPERHTDAESTFPETLMAYVRAARAAGAVPVLCASVSRRFFVGNESDFLLYTHGAYPSAVRRLCAKEQIALIDLEQQSRALLLSLGMEASQQLYVNLEPGEHADYPQGVADKTHFSLAGAQAVARMVVKALHEQSLLDVGETCF